MSTSNKGRGVDSRLQNLTNSLYLTPDNDVAIRTGITGNINITGPVTIPGTVTVASSPLDPVHVHVTEIPEVEIKNDGGNPIPVSGSVSITNVSAIPVTIQSPTPTFYQFNNFGTFSHRGWTMSDTQIPMFAVRAKPASGITLKIAEYELGNNNNASSTIVYVWYQDPTLTGAYSWVDLGSSNIQYAVFTDAYGSNTPNGISGGTTRHSGIIIGKNSSAEAEIGEIPITNSTVLAIAVQRLDSATKLDLWFAVTLEI